MVQANPAEYALLGISMLSVGVTVWSLWDVIKDLHWLTATHQDGGRRMVAENNVLQEALKLTVQVVILITALAFVATAPPPPDRQFVSHFFIGIASWMVVSVIMLAASLLSRSLRRKLNNYLTSNYGDRDGQENRRRGQTP